MYGLHCGRVVSIRRQKVRCIVCVAHGHSDNINGEKDIYSFLDEYRGLFVAFRDFTQIGEYLWINLVRHFGEILTKLFSSGVDGIPRLDASEVNCDSLISVSQTRKKAALLSVKFWMIFLIDLPDIVTR